jgi:hypothetical protein
MRACLLLAIAASALSLHCPAVAESLRCENGIAAEGDSRLALAYKCGAPSMRDSYCAPVFYTGTPYLVPEPIAGLSVPCVLNEDWVYERGLGNLVATVRIRGGRIQAIYYGRAPQ